VKQLVGWFARNPVAANLLMVTIIVAGAVTLPQIKTEVFPEFSADVITVQVIHPGASPEEIEESICVRIEEQVQGLTGVRRITSQSSEGAGTVSVEVLKGADARQLLDDVKARVDAIDNFPEDAEKPIVQEVVVRNQVIDVAIYGGADEKSLKRLAERVRDELSALPEITLVEITSARPYEISIELSEIALQRYALTFDDVARAVRQGSLDLPGGSLKTEGGEILLRTKAQAYSGRDFERIVLRTRRDGSKVYLGDVATVHDGFEETDQASRFDGENAVVLSVYRVGDQDALVLGRAVREFVAENKDLLPVGISMLTWRDTSRILQERVDLLLKNGSQGLALVFLVLALFLRFRLAFWVSIGIPLSFLGAFWMMPILGVSINMVSLFAFILVLGIVVDDAIVVGENIHAHVRRGTPPQDAAVKGVQEVAVPVIFAVLTTVAAFWPLLGIPGTMGKIFRVMPLVVIPTLLFSIVESQWILPAHLTHLQENGQPRFRIARSWRKIQGRFADGLDRFIENVYGPALDFGLRNRYLVASVAIATLLFTVGLVGGGRMKFVFMPPVESDTIAALLTMPQGTSAETTQRTIKAIEAAAIELEDEIEQEQGAEVFRHVRTTVGEQPFVSRSGGPMGDSGGLGGAHMGEVQIELVGSDQRSLSSTDIANRWRDKVGLVADAVELRYVASLFNAGAAIEVQMASADLEALQRAADELKVRLAEFPGATDIRDDYRSGKTELKLKLTPEGEAAGLTLGALARQVRQGFYGEEAQRIQRGRDDLRVMIRYPESERRSLGDLENMRVRLPDGSELAFAVVAEAEMGRGFSSIQRADRRRVISVSCGIDQDVTTANDVRAVLEGEIMPAIQVDMPSVSYTFEGEQKEQAESLEGLKYGFLLAIFLIYALMAVPFKSYLQPLMVMSAIPFGIVGAIWGHAIMGWKLTILSIIGIVALAGVVVNDSLVLVDFVNRQRREHGKKLVEAVEIAGRRRFRPILLTSLTTFAGLTPMLFERSLQAQFLIPMAISLAYGVMFSTFITLLLVPANYIILEDLKRFIGRLVGRGSRVAEAARDVS
jgi:multidrug efflux pump subunit AcrB